MTQGAGAVAAPALTEQDPHHREDAESVKKKLTAAVAALVAALALAGCGIDHGYVTAKSYDDADVWMSYVSNGRGGMTPVTHRDPECWQLDLELEEDGKLRTGSTCVDEGTWDELEVGDYYAPPAN